MPLKKKSEDLFPGAERSIPETYDEVSDLPALPLPEFSELPGLSQLKSDKSARMELPELPDVPESVGHSRSLDMSDIPDLPDLASNSTEHPHSKVRKTLPYSSKERQLFIKLDRFKEIVSTIETISHKLHHLENTFKEIRGQKLREKEEMDKWEKEIVEIKEKLFLLEKSLSRHG